MASHAAPGAEPASDVSALRGIDSQPHQTLDGSPFPAGGAAFGGIGSHYGLPTDWSFLARPPVSGPFGPSHPFIGQFGTGGQIPAGLYGGFSQHQYSARQTGPTVAPPTAAFAENLQQQASNGLSSGQNGSSSRQGGSSPIHSSSNTPENSAEPSMSLNLFC